MKFFPLSSIVFLWSAILMSHSVQAQNPAGGDEVFRTDFETAAERDAWEKKDCASWVTMPNRGTCLKVVADKVNGGEQAMIRLPVDLSKYENCVLEFRCLARADKVTKPAKSYLGVKYMLHQVSSVEVPKWTNEGNVHGTFDWKRIGFTTSVSKKLTGAWLCLGLQGCKGTAYFDDLQVRVFRVRPRRPKPDPNAPPAFRGHSLPRLRGCMSPHSFRDEDLKVLGRDWNANVIRWQMTTRWGAGYKYEGDYNLKLYNEWLDAELDELEKALEACRRYGLMAVVDLHSPPGGRCENRDLVFIHEKKYLDAFIASWEKIARRFKGNPAIWGYDLINEPVQGKALEPGETDYLQAQVLAARAVRAIDPKTPIIIEVDHWDSAEGFRYLEPVPLERVIYQVHMYWPGSFTHQGVHSNDKVYEYPGKIGGIQVGKEELRKSLAPVREFQQAYNVHIYVGEFSAIRWAPNESAYRYLRDAIEIFEEYGWDWTYHAFREWDGWSLEHGPVRENRERNKTPGKRLQLFLDWFAKNKKPSFTGSEAAK